MNNYDKDIDKTLKWFNRSENKKGLTTTFLIALVLIVITIIGGLLHDSYDSLQSNNKLNDKLLNKFNNQGISYIKLNGDQKYKLRVFENSSYSPSYFIEFVQRGDSIIKNCDTDTIYIHRENEEYYFLIKEYLKE